MNPALDPTPQQDSSEMDTLDRTTGGLATGGICILIVIVIAIRWSYAYNENKRRERRRRERSEDEQVAIHLVDLSGRRRERPADEQLAIPLRTLSGDTLHETRDASASWTDEQLLMKLVGQENATQPRPVDGQNEQPSFGRRVLDTVARGWHEGLLR
ncbi:MAG: hypothetical protein L6R39_002958 [Caloplaca ligustica]|nr:MAG: hypothetical protein L6R39_002958 [Caloplaca ligustica]